MSDEAGGYQPGPKALVAGARQDWVAAPDAELDIACDGGLQQGGRNRREEGLDYLGDGPGRAGMEPFLSPVETANDLFQLLAPRGERRAAGVEARVRGRSASGGGVPEVAVAGCDQFLGKRLEELH